MIDEAIDLIPKQYLIIYVIYLSNIEKGPHVTKFIELVALRNGTTKSMYKVVNGLLEKMHWMSLNQVVLATNKTSSIQCNQWSFKAWVTLCT